MGNKMKDFDLWDIELEASRFKPYPTQDSFLDNRYTQQMSTGQEWPYYRFFLSSKQNHET